MYVAQAKLEIRAHRQGYLDRAVGILNLSDDAEGQIVLDGAIEEGMARSAKGGMGRAGQRRITWHDPLPARRRHAPSTQIRHPIWQQAPLRRPYANSRIPGVYLDGKADSAVVTPEIQQE